MSNRTAHEVAGFRSILRFIGWIVDPQTTPLLVTFPATKGSYRALSKISTHFVMWEEAATKQAQPTSPHIHAIIDISGMPTRQVKNLLATALKVPFDYRWIGKTLADARTVLNYIHKRYSRLFLPRGYRRVHWHGNFSKWRICAREFYTLISSVRLPPTRAARELSERAKQGGFLRALQWRNEQSNPQKRE